MTGTIELKPTLVESATRIMAINTLLQKPLNRILDICDQARVAHPEAEKELGEIEAEARFMKGELGV